MSDLLNKASLVMIPSGYKEDTVYSVVPSDGSGDLSFTRASNGTRINSAGLVEVCPWNLLQYSEDFSNAVWTKVDCTVTADSITAPNGTSTADSLLDNTSNFIHALTPALSKATTEITYTHSVYAKFKDTDRKIQLSLDDAVSGGIDSGVFNLSTGVWDTALGTPTAAFTNPSRNFENVGNGWYRISLTVTSNAGSQIRPNIFVINGSNASLYIGNGTGIYIYGAQLNIGSTAKPYFPTTDRLNVPRLTYQNGGGGCPSLLLEKQSTNLYPYSEDLTQWTTSGSVTVTGNDSVSPDGTTNADRVQFSASTDMVYNSGTGSAGTNVVSVWAKAKSGTAQKFRFFVNGATTYSSDLTATDQWQRFDFVYTYSAQTVGLRGATTGASDVLFWGFQHEVSSYPTSYIPTTSASATRVADACYKTGISSLIGQSEGTIFADINPEEFVNGSYLGITDGTITNRIIFGFESGSVNSGTLLVFGLSGLSSGGTYTRGQRIKVALAYKSGDSVLYVNGSQIQTATTTFSGSFSQFRFDSFAGTQNFIGKVNESLLSKTRLTNAELASLTTI